MRLDSFVLVRLGLFGTGMPASPCEELATGVQQTNGEAPADSGPQQPAAPSSSGVLSSRRYQRETTIRTDPR